MKPERESPWFKGWIRGYSEGYEDGERKALLLLKQSLKHDRVHRPSSNPLDRLQGS